MVYILYKITCLVNGKIYIGVHKTMDIDDGYMGSGTYLKRAQQKYGLNNFKKEVLEVFKNEEEMYLREHELVNESFVLREDTYNLIPGGGFVHAASAAGKITLEKKLGWFSKEARLHNAEFNRSQRMRDLTSKRSKSEFNKEVLKKMTVMAQQSSAKEKRKKTLKEINHQQGEKNSNFGKKWITNGTESKTIKKEEPIPDGWWTGRVIKKA